MNLSLSEAEALARKAMRGAGASWGHAEEAGKAVRWLAARGLPGPKRLTQLLKEWPGEGVQGDRESGWHGATGRLCPIRAGCLLQDHAGLDGPDQVRFHQVVVPDLMLPFAAASGMPFDAPRGDISDIVARRAHHEPAPETASVCPVDADTHASLEAWAAQTYVPASDASRAAAGSTLSDND